MNNSEEHLTAPFLHFETIAYTNFEVKLASLARRSHWLFSTNIFAAFRLRHHSYTGKWKTSTKTVVPASITTYYNNKTHSESRFSWRKAIPEQFGTSAPRKLPTRLSNQLFVPAFVVSQRQQKQEGKKLVLAQYINTDMQPWRRSSVLIFGYWYRFFSQKWCAYARASIWYLCWAAERCRSWLAVTYRLAE